jgi:hypothetical protein
MTLGLFSRDRDPHPRRDLAAGRHAACLTGGCVWDRLARLEHQAEGFTPFGQLLRAYYLDLTGLCGCPHVRASRRI